MTNGESGNKKPWAERLSEAPLVVCFDDKFEILQSHRLHFQSKNMRVNAIEIDGSETPDELKTIVYEALGGHPAAVVTDYNMNGITGKHVLDLFNAFYANKDETPPIMLFTGETTHIGSPVGTPTGYAAKQGFEHVFEKTEQAVMVRKIKQMIADTDLPPK